MGYVFGHLCCDESQKKKDFFNLDPRIFLPFVLLSEAGIVQWVRRLVGRGMCTDSYS